MKKYVALGAFGVLVLIGWYFWAGLSNWCHMGDSFKMKDANVSVIGLFKYAKLGGDYCYARSATGQIITYYWVDKVALAAMRSGNAKEAGRGCLVMKVSGTKTGTELCW